MRCGLRVSRQLHSIANLSAGSVYRLRVAITQAFNMPAEVFLHTRRILDVETGFSTDSLVGVASFSDFDVYATSAPEQVPIGPALVFENGGFARLENGGFLLLDSPALSYVPMPGSLPTVLGQAALAQFFRKSYYDVLVGSEFDAALLWAATKYELQALQQMFSRQSLVFDATSTLLPPPTDGPEEDGLQLENGGYLLLEDGNYLLLG